MGIWVAVAVGLFVLGCIMALKPNAIEMRVDKLRMAARRLDLHPKLIACPSWVRGRQGEFGKGMIAQYSLILEDLKVTEICYQVEQGKLVVSGSSKNTADKPVVVNTAMVNKSLEGMALELPKDMISLIKAVYLKANGVVVFWDDAGYVQPSLERKYIAEQVERDLEVLKAQMIKWAQQASGKA